MQVAQTKRKENIAEYILYLWQIEDMLRALQFSPEAIYSTLVDKADIEQAEKQEELLWYMSLVDLLRSEGKSEKGHLGHTMHLISDMNDLHKELLTLPYGAEYRVLYSSVAPELPRLKAMLDSSDMSDIELCFRALYAVMLYRMKGNDNAGKDVLELISPLIAQLSLIYHQIERGETDIYAKE